MTKAPPAERLIVLVLVLVVLNSLLTAALLISTVAHPRGSSGASRDDSVPCVTLPVRFVHEEPTCVNKLLGALNITRVQIMPVKADVTTGSSAERNRTSP